MLNTMNEKKVALPLIGALLAMTGCHSQAIPQNITADFNIASSSQELSDVYQIDTDGYIWNYFDALDVPYRSGQNYESFTDEAQTGFRYCVFDNTGVIIDQGYHEWRGSFSFEEQDGILILDYGYGGPVWYRRYYDVSNGRVSRFFFRPLDISNELVAYFASNDTGIVLVIQNMFDPSIYYQEIERDFSDAVVTLGAGKAEFLHNGTQLKLTYYINPDSEKVDNEVTEVITLP